MNFRSLELKDIESIKELLTNSEPYVLPYLHYVYWIMQQYFPNSNLVALDNEKIIGFICVLLSADKNCAFIWQIAVDPNYREKGIATKLLLNIIDYLKDSKYESLQFSIGKANIASFNLFNSLCNRINCTLEKIGEYNSLDVIDNVYCINLNNSI